ncbi:hypothetical protein B14_200045 (plasmid) [Bacillus licheniformis]|uniref:hypothetical protein n=1 Tax=Bacillus licheniformis TaxID=1402 RepID=UPI0009B79C89|nr:hypothetical protein [Bacillus licheniformis]ARC67256.1 hypothetical protein B14_200045 [Bacillus licheniformis]ARW46103.1 hypothetical protein S100141_04883 [Bacillus licheniformis]MDE1421912.1 hypothetical protein [Bacillus licheniformis]MEC0475917.1 hypothetical protein [Bacillus licheniformis]QAS18757.1 hypothetical protein EQJ69_22810 [Bacillus licheniformis]
MIVYHGTSEHRAKKILEDKTIKHEIDRVHHLIEEMKTTDGYTYVSNMFSVAAYFGNLTTIVEDKESPYYYVFEIDISESELHPDWDETNPNINLQLDTSRSYENLTVQESFDLFHSASINRDLQLGVDVKRYMKLPSTSFTYKGDFHIRNHSIEIIRTGNKKKEFPIKDVLKKFNWNTL